MNELRLKSLECEKDAVIFNKSSEGAGISSTQMGDTNVTYHSYWQIRELRDWLDAAIRELEGGTG